MNCANKKLVSLIDVHNFFGSDLDRSRTTVLEIVKCMWSKSPLPQTTDLIAKHSNAAASLQEIPLDFAVACQFCGSWN